MARILSLLVVVWLAACAQEKAPMQKVPAPKPTPINVQTETADLDFKIKSHFCAAMADCIVSNKSNIDFDYGPWFSKLLEMDSLKDLKTSQTSYVAVGPDAEGYNTNIGMIKYKLAASEKSLILKQLRDLPNSMFTDDKVLMRFKAITDDEHLIVIFTDDHGPQTTAFFQTL